MKNKVAAVSAAIYTSTALVLAGAFVGAATFAGRYTWLERGAGAAWVFLLAMIIFIPVVTPRVRKRLGGSGTD